jgi:hypothetical protein
LKLNLALDLLQPNEMDRLKTLKNPTWHGSEKY